MNAVGRYLDALARGDPVALAGTGAFVVLVLAVLLAHRWYREEQRRRPRGPL
jgi:hypothetical protein